MYKCRLEERFRRKCFVLERGLLDPRKLNGTDQRRSKDEAELFARCRVFARLLAPEQHSELVAALTEEQRLRKRIQLLQVGAEEEDGGGREKDVRR